MAVRHKSVETKYMEERDAALRGLRHLDRRTFLKVLAATTGAALSKGLITPHTFQLVNVANATVDKTASATGTSGAPPFSFAYIRKEGLAEMMYSLWDRNPVTVSAGYLRSNGKVYRPPQPQFASY